jgi:hypothetical protein
MKRGSDEGHLIEVQVASSDGRSDQSFITSPTQYGLSTALHVPCFTWYEWRSEAQLSIFSPTSQY